MNHLAHSNSNFQILRSSRDALRDSNRLSPGEADVQNCLLLIFILSTISRTCFYGVQDNATVLLQLEQ